MKSLIRLATIAAVVAGGGFFSAAPAVSASPTAVEKLYQDLVKLDPQARTRKLIEGAAKEGELNLVMTIRDKLGRDHTALFAKAYPMFKVKAVEKGSQDASENIIIEATAKRYLSDITNLAIPDLTRIVDMDYAARYPSPATDKIFPQYRSFLDPEARWFPWYWSENGLIYNTNLVSADKAPKDYFDLCRPEFKGQVGMEPANVRFLVGMYKLLGDEKLRAWMECMGKNNPLVTANHSVRLQLMLAGDYMLDAGNYLYRGTQMKQENPAKVPFAADYDVPVFGYGGAWVIGENAPHPHAAALLADWSLTDESQDYMAANFRSPLTRKHPFMPDNAQLMMYGMESPEIVDRIMNYWKEYVGKKG